MQREKAWVIERKLAGVLRDFFFFPKINHLSFCKFHHVSGIWLNALGWILAFSLQCLQFDVLMKARHQNLTGHCKAVLIVFFSFTSPLTHSCSAIYAGNGIESFLPPSYIQLCCVYFHWLIHLSFCLFCLPPACISACEFIHGLMSALFLIGSNK